MITLGDGASGLAGLRNVNAVISDLPSGATRAPFDVAPDLAKLNDAIWQALAPNGIAVLMASNIRFAAEVMSGINHFRYDIIWHKGMATGFFNAKKQPLRAHEFILVFYRNPGTYNVQMTTGHRPINYNERQGGHGSNYGKQGAPSRSRAGATDRYPTSVLATKVVGTSCKTRIHPQQKPPELMEWLVGAFTNPGDLVVDPFAGSGSTGHAALGMGREFIGWDTDEKFGS